jgi:hypothetical protein
MVPGAPKVVWLLRFAGGNVTKKHLGIGACFLVACDSESHVCA